MKVENMRSNRGNKVPNQFIITTETPEGNKVEYLQSYQTIIAKKIYDNLGCYVVETFLDKNAYNYSVTTAKYRNSFLGVSSKDFKAKDYILTDLNNVSWYIVNSCFGFHSACCGVETMREIYLKYKFYLLIYKIINGGKNANNR